MDRAAPKARRAVRTMAMNWRRRLSQPLKGKHGRELRTLHDARAYVIEFGGIAARRLEHPALAAQAKSHCYTLGAAASNTVSVDV